MVSPIIIIEPLKNLNIKCLNVLKLLNNRLNIHNGNSTELPRVKSSIIMPLLESLVGSFLTKSNSISESCNNKNGSRDN